MGPTHEEVTKMIHDAIDRYDDLVKGRYESMDVNLRSLADSNIENGQKLSYLQAQMSSLYGNGAGRIGAIEILNSKMDNISTQVAEIIGKEAGIEKTRGRYHAFLYWIGGGIVSVGLALLMRFLDHVK